MLVTVTFDKPLEPASVDERNWTLAHGGQLSTALNATSAASEVLVQFGEVSDPEQISYTPPPFDVVGENGLPVEPFSMEL